MLESEPGRMRLIESDETALEVFEVDYVGRAIHQRSQEVAVPHSGAIAFPGSAFLPIHCLGPDQLASGVINRHCDRSGAGVVAAYTGAPNRGLLDLASLACLFLVGRALPSQLSREQVGIPLSDYLFKLLPRFGDKCLIGKDYLAFQIAAKDLLRKRVNHRVEECLNFQLDLLVCMFVTASLCSYILFVSCREAFKPTWEQRP